jgi:hypothetical protein
MNHSTPLSSVPRVLFSPYQTNHNRGQEVIGHGPGSPIEMRNHPGPFMVGRFLISSNPSVIARSGQRLPRSHGRHQSAFMSLTSLPRCLDIPAVV